ncbi:MAG: helix-turn-helix transcriptional regulator [Chloroflexota bacterium]|nr:helix-turn-helix transcriptional regulator [Chloroflexota bacterium]MDE2885423.1 helix-turn-helix transcriptional regulator [Chloroflexota bacterium]
MTSGETVTLSRQEYDALVQRNGELEDRLTALEADDGVRIPHEVALAMLNGERPIIAFRKHQGLTLTALSAKAGLAIGYLSDIERGRKAGSASALSRIASALGTTIDVLVNE